MNSPCVWQRDGDRAGRPAVIFDMDGTLVDIAPIRHWVRREELGAARNFDRFHAEAVDMVPHGWVVRCAQYADAAGFDVLIVTARNARFRHQTAWWLALHQVPSAALFMRGEHDTRPDHEVKRDMLTQIRAAGWQVVHAVDDNPEVLALWLSAGIPVTEVPVSR